MSQPDQPARLRWSRSLRLRLTSRGVEAVTTWKERVATFRGQGRPAFEDALQTWATSFRVTPDDASLAAELEATPARLEDLARAVADTGTSREGVRQGLERLYEAGLLEPVPAP